jgi:transcriptional regulator with XRE-family HTH domain
MAPLAHKTDREIAAPSPLAMRIGKNIARLRNEKGWTNKAMADMIGVQQDYVSSLESGVKKPSLKYIEDVLAPLFGVDPQEFFLNR